MRHVKLVGCRDNNALGPPLRQQLREILKPVDAQVLGQFLGLRRRIDNSSESGLVNWSALTRLLE